MVWLCGIIIFITFIGIVLRYVVAIGLYKDVVRLQKLNLDDPDDYRAAIEICYGKPVETYENATLICTEQYTPTNDKAIIYDFSKWEDSKIIGIISVSKNAKNDEDDEPRINIVPKQTVCKYEDGTILWLQES